MTVAHEIFDVFGFVVALTGLIHIYVKGEMSRRFIAVTIAVLLLGLGGVVVYEHIEHRRLVEKVQTHIRESLVSGPKTVEELADGMQFGEQPLLKEALDDVTEDGGVKSQMYSLAQTDGSVVHKVLLYYNARAVN